MSFWVLVGRGRGVGFRGRGGLGRVLMRVMVGMRGGGRVVVVMVVVMVGGVKVRMRELLLGGLRNGEKLKVEFEVVRGEDVVRMKEEVMVLKGSDLKG